MNPDMGPHREIMRAYERMQAYERLIQHMTDEEREDLVYIADLVRQIENAISPLEDSLDDLATSLLFSTLTPHVDWLKALHPFLDEYGLAFFSCVEGVYEPGIMSVTRRPQLAVSNKRPHPPRPPGVPAREGV
jgi:hypothetical protein